MLKTVLGLGFLLLAPVSYADNSRDLFVELYGERGSALPLEYQELEGLRGQELLEALHKKSGRGYRQYEYKEAKSMLYDSLYNFQGKVKTIYSGLSFAKSGGRYAEHGDQDHDGYEDDFVNCEHIWPQSKFNKDLPMVSDLHHLYPSLSVPNRMRSSYPFGEVGSSYSYSTISGSRLGGDEFEPADEDKGNVARAMLYFFTRYYNRNIWQKTQRHDFWDSRVSMFLEWNRLDPVDGAESARNDRIAKKQGNRNPFVDYPEFADRIGESVFTHSGRFSSDMTDASPSIVSEEDLGDD